LLHILQQLQQLYCLFFSFSFRTSFQQLWVIVNVTYDLF
jgi:hypothetical protein